MEDGAASLLDVLSLLDPEGIPGYILGTDESTFRWEGYPQDIMGYQEARTELLKSSLITRDRGAKKLFIHRLIQDAAPASMSDERFDLTFGFMLCLLSSAWPYDEFGFGNEQYRWARCNEIYRRVLRLREVCERSHPPDELSQVSIEPPRFLLDIARWVPICLKPQGTSRTQIPDSVSFPTFSTLFPSREAQRLMDESVASITSLQWVMSIIGRATVA